MSDVQRICSPRCHAPWQQMIVDAAGTVHPCSFWGTYSNTNGLPSFGNLNDATLEEIWNNAAFQRLRKHMAAGNLELAGCNNCYAIKQGLALGLDYDPDCEKEHGEPTSYAANIATLKQEIASGATVLAARPTIVSYTPSHKCNLRCVQCYQEGTRKAELTRSTADRDIQSLAPYLIRLIAGGGEPFLLKIWKEFLRDFDVAKNPYLDFGVTTNGTLISDDVVTGLNRFKSLTINISVDATGEVIESVRKGLSWPVLVENIHKLKQVVAAKGGRSNIGITACIQKSTIRDLPNLVRFSLQEGLSFGLSPVITMPPDESLACFNSHPKVEMEGWKEALDEARRIWFDHLADGYFGDWDTYRRLNNLGDASREQTVPEEVYLAWMQVFDGIDKVINWSRTDEPHQPVDVTIAPAILEMFRSSEYLNKLFNGEPLIAYIFRKGQAVGNAPYWAPISEDGSFSAWLPKGEYAVNLSTKWFNPEYREILVFKVSDEVQTLTAKPGGALQPRVVRIFKRVLGSLRPNN